MFFGILSEMHSSISLRVFSSVLLLSIAMPVAAREAPSVPSAYKVALWGGEIPIDWSYVRTRGDIPLAKFPRTGIIPPDAIRASIARDGVAYGDLNWNQLDIYLMAGRDVERLIRIWQRNAAIRSNVQSWSEAEIGGVSATVANLILDASGTPSKAGTGGRVYFLSWQANIPRGEGEKPRTVDFGMIFDQQARGDAAFEAAIVHFLATVDLADFAQQMSGMYPVRRAK
jgi:hypothetical protein